MTSGIARTLKPLLFAASAASLMAAAPAWCHSDDAMRSGQLDSAVTRIEHSLNGRVSDIRPLAGTADDLVAVVARRHGAEVVRFDPAAGTVTQLDRSALPEWTDRDLQPDRLRAARHARFDLTDAIRKAADDSDAMPLSAHVAQRDAITAYDIHLRTSNGDTQRVVIDANTGARIANPREFLTDFAS